MRSTPLLKLVAAIALGLVAIGCTTSAAVESSPNDRTDVAQPTVAAVEPTARPAATPAIPTSPTTAPPTPAPTATTAPTATPLPSPTPPPTPTPVTPRAEVATADHDGLAGTRGLTLQWISWEPDEWGAIEFTPLVDGSYFVSGTQEGPTGDSVSVEGSIERLNERELLFDGVIVVDVRFLNDPSNPCVREGQQTFFASGQRRFWRLQDITSCDGNHADYVDIYWG